MVDSSSKAKILLCTQSWRALSSTQRREKNVKIVRIFSMAVGIATWMEKHEQAIVHTLHHQTAKMVARHP
jgi:hypothetical protein